MDQNDPSCAQAGPCANGITVNGSVGPNQTVAYQPNNIVCTMDDFLARAPFAFPWNGTGTNPVCDYAIGRAWAPNSLVWPRNDMIIIEPGATNAGGQNEHDLQVSEPGQYGITNYDIIAGDVTPNWSPANECDHVGSATWSSCIESRPGSSRIFANIAATCEGPNCPSQPIVMQYFDRKGVQHHKSLQLSPSGIPSWKKID